MNQKHGENEMKIEIREFGHSTKPSVFGIVRLKLTADAGQSIVINDVQVLETPNRGIRLVMPRYRGRRCSLPAIVLCKSLKLAAEDAVERAYWQRECEYFERAGEDGLIDYDEIQSTADTPGATGPQRTLHQKDSV
jgi:hypothetical protein